MATKTKEELQRESKIAIANACLLVRDALRETLPIAPEQYMTVSIPGTVVDTNDIAVGGTYVYDAVANPFPPTQVRQAGSRPVDGLMPLANVMLGNTGQSRIDHPTDNAAAVQQFNDWQQEHYRRFKNEVQARFIDWVTTGDKYNVGYNFGLVDVDSIMARIERSKQSMRDNQIVDADGADEWQLVTLNPRHGQPCAVTRAKPDDPPARPVQPEKSLSALNQELKDAYTTLYSAKGKLNSAKSDDPNLNALKQIVSTMQTPLNQALNDHAKVADAWVKFTLLTSGADWLPGVIDTVRDQIAKLETLQDNLARSSRYSIAPILSANPADTDGAQGSSNEVASLGSELASPLFGIIPPQDTPATPSTSSGAGDVWTHISASFSAADQRFTTTQSSWGMSAGASFGWGLWSAGGSYAHEQSGTDFKSAMVSVDVSVSFSALVVNITRPWLYAELFNDYELDTATDVLLYPGAEDLQNLITKQSEDRIALRTLAQYNTFPAFPNSFIVASDVVLEFTSKTQAIEQHLHSESNTANARFGWGPFSVGGSFHQTSSRSEFHMQTNATGVKISFAAPQIIAWVSQNLPVLPKKPGI